MDVGNLMEKESWLGRWVGYCYKQAWKGGKGRYFVSMVCYNECLGNPDRKGRVQGAGSWLGEKWWEVDIAVHKMDFFEFGQEQRWVHFDKGKGFNC